MILWNKERNYFDKKTFNLDGTDNLVTVSTITKRKSDISHIRQIENESLSMLSTISRAFSLPIRTSESYEIIPNKIISGYLKSFIGTHTFSDQKYLRNYITLV